MTLVHQHISVILCTLLYGLYITNLSLAPGTVGMQTALDVMAKRNSQGYLISFTIAAGSAQTTKIQLHQNGPFPGPFLNLVVSNTGILTTEPQSSVHFSKDERTKGHTATCILNL